MSSQAKKVKNQILASKISVIRSLNNEKALQYELNHFFQELKRTVLHELEEYYNPDFMFQGHADLILAPIFEAQQEYYNILRKFNHKEYHFGRKEGRRLVKLARRRAKRRSISYADKASQTPSILTANIKKEDNLFGINEWSEQELLNRSFAASEKTMNRIDSDINKILSNGYREGKGINEVRNDITKRFDQLSSWEATRIARTEIHNAHNMGTMDIYQEMGVEYTQWIAAHDSRTRDSHKLVDRQIIPMGGTYSNGLRYPGDTRGPLKEWINCRCSNAPFIIPDGYIAPSFTPFKETDLIPTLDYWNQDELITQATQETRDSTLLKGFGIDKDLPLDTKLMEREFGVAPAELAEDFGISSEGMDTIRQFQKESHLSKRELGFAFSENNGRIYTGLVQGNADWIGIRTPGKCSTIHNHTSKGFNIPSGDDFFAYLKTGNERLAFNCSNDEIWVIQHANKKGLSNKYVNSIADKVDELAYKYSQKFKQEYRNELKRINKIDDPELKQIELDKLKKDVNTKLLKKYDQKLGDELLEYTSTVDGLKVKRYTNVKIDKKEISDLPNLKPEKSKGDVRRSKLVDNTERKGKNSRHAPKINKDPLLINKDSNKVVNLNGKKVYGIGETQKDQHNFLKKWAIKKGELTRAEFNFVKLYSGDGDRIINGYYRDMSKAVTSYKQKSIKEKYSDEWESLKIKYSEYYIPFDEALNISKTIFKKGKILDEDLLVVRRQSSPLLTYAHYGIYHSDSLLSTTISNNVKPDIYGDYLAYIVVPKGTRIFYIEGITSTRDDLEILFGIDKNIKFLKQESDYVSHWVLL